MFRYCSFLKLLKQLIHLFCIFIHCEFLLPAGNSPKLCPCLNAGIIGAICNWLQTIDLVEEARLSTLCLCMERCMPACAYVHTDTQMQTHTPVFLQACKNGNLGACSVKYVVCFTSLYRLQFQSWKQNTEPTAC